MDWNIEKRDTVSSTQDALREVLLLRVDTPEGYGILARSQTKGRGRHGRVWQSDAGNFYLSFILRPNCTPQEVGQISLLTGLAVAQVLEGLIGGMGDIRLKWPNDVQVNGRKISGILIEREGQALLVGVGINIGNAPHEQAIALDDMTDERNDCGAVLDVFLKTFGGLYRQWQEQGFAEIREMWLARSFAAGASVQVKIGGDPKEGMFHDIDMEGNLLMKGADNALVRVSSGDVYFT